MERKPQLFFVIITLAAIFLYIHHQNTIIRLTCDQQRIERTVAQLKQDEQALKKALCQTCSLDGVAQHARELGMQPTAVTQIHEMPVSTNNPELRAENTPVRPEPVEGVEGRERRHQEGTSHGA
jgi:hypothetical protein